MYSGKQAEEVDMICNTADRDDGATESLTCASQIRVHLISNVRVGKERKSMFRGEDNVHIYL